VPAGSYSISAVLAGFSVARQELTVWHEALTVDLTLQPGSFAEEITVIGARLVGSEEMLRRIPGSVDVLPSDVLEASHVFTTGEALRKVPGVLVRDEEGLGLRPNIGIRGLNPTRSTKALLLEDGVPTTYAPYGDNATYYHPPIERFEAIEVVKGSGQIAYGPVTVGGVVNYITPDPPARRSTAVTIEGGNRDFLSGHVDFGGTWGGTGLLLDAMRKQSDGARENQRSELNDISVKWLQQLSPRQNLSVKANYYGEGTQITYSGLRDDEYRANPRQNSFANDDFNGDRGGFSAPIEPSSATISPSPRPDIPRCSIATGGVSPATPASGPTMPPTQRAAAWPTEHDLWERGACRRYYLLGVEPRVRISYRAFGIGQETDAGLRFHVEDQDRRQENGATPTARSGVLVEDNHRTANAVSSFLQHRLLMDRWTVTPGAQSRADRVRPHQPSGKRGAGVSGETSLTEIILGLGVAYAATPQATVFAGLHRGFAPPRVEDVINNNTGGVVELDPERSWNAEIGLRAQVAQGLRVDGAFFQMDYENQIVPASLAGGVGATPTNGGETLHRGVEVVARSTATR
jgi:Fe(3+) dicitrate transport protein